MLEGVPLFKVADPPERVATKSDASRSPLPDDVLKTSLPNVTLTLLSESTPAEDISPARPDV